MEFNKREFNNFRNDLNDVVKNLEEKYQVKIKSGKIKYNDVDFTIVLEVSKASDGFNAEQEKFERMCELFGFKKEDYGFKFKVNGEEFEFVGFNPSKPKNNCNMRNVANGKTYMTNDEYIRNAMKLSKL